MSSQMAHQIHIGVEIRNSTTGIKAEQMASSALCLWIQDLGKIYNSYVTHFVNTHFRFLLKIGFYFLCWLFLAYLHTSIPVCRYTVKFFSGVKINKFLTIVLCIYHNIFFIFPLCACKLDTFSLHYLTFMYKSQFEKVPISKKTADHGSHDQHSMIRTKNVENGGKIKGSS